MHESVVGVKHQIAERGGVLSADVVGNLFSGEGIRFSDDFWPWKCFDVIFERIYGSSNKLSKRSEIEIRPAVPSRGFNVIPAPPGDGQCSELCVVFASQGMQGRRGWHGNPEWLDIDFTAATLLLAAHWFDCMGTNKETVILTSSWTQQDFDEIYEPLIKSYRSRTGGRVFIVEVTKSGPFLRWPY